MKNEVAARAVAMAELARSGFRPRGDLWFIAVADEEDGFADVGMRWLLEERTDIRPTHSVNEGGGERLPLSDGREMVCYSVGEKGTLPVQVTAVGEAGHASVPTLGRNAVPLLARLLPRLGDGLPEPSTAPEAIAMLRALLGRDEPDLAEGAGGGRRAVRRARRHDPGADGLDDGADDAVGLEQAQRDAGPGDRRGRQPDPARVRRRRTSRRGCGRRSATTSPTSWTGPRRWSPASSSPVDGVVPAAIAAFLEAEGDPGTLLPTLCTGFTDSNFLRAAGGTHAYGFSPFRATPNDVLEAGYHNANERVHVDDLLLSTRFHLDLARRVLG